MTTEITTEPQVVTQTRLARLKGLIGDKPQYLSIIVEDLGYDEMLDLLRGWVVGDDAVPLKNRYEVQGAFCRSLWVDYTDSTGAKRLKDYGSAIAMIDTIGTQWVTAKHTNPEYQGKLPQRVKKYLMKTFGYTMPNAMVASLGEYAKKRYAPSVWWDVTNHLDWEAGDFGDSGSCFWDERENALQALRDHDTFALRVYKKLGERFSGYGRAWIIPQRNDSLVMINAYGEPLEKTGGDIYEPLGREWNTMRDSRQE